MFIVDDNDYELASLYKLLTIINLKQPYDCTFYLYLHVFDKMHGDVMNKLLTGWYERS